MDIIKVILTSILSVIVLFVIAKIMGHKQVAQLDFFDYVSGITIGSIAAELATELEEPLQPLIALIVYGIISLLLNLLGHKFEKSRKFINGTPTIIMDNGKIYRKNLKKSKLDLSEFMLLCREQGYFDLSEIQTAIFEYNGKISILPVEKNRPITPKDMNLHPSQKLFSTEIIMDGRILGENLSRMKLDEKWLYSKLKALGYDSEKQILLGLCDSNMQVTLYPIE